MNSKNTNISTEEFKAKLLDWKERHIEEYNRFARLMKSGVVPWKVLAQIIPYMTNIASQWNCVWNSEDLEGLDNLTMNIDMSGLSTTFLEEFSPSQEQEQEETAPANLLMRGVRRLFRKAPTAKPSTDVALSLPLVMSWMYFGKSYEAIYEIVVEQLAKQGIDFTDISNIAVGAKFIVDASITNGMRTPEDWRKYFRRNKALKVGNPDINDWIMELFELATSSVEKSEATLISTSEPVTETWTPTQESDQPKTPGRKKSEEKPLIEYLNCENPETVIEVIKNFLLRYKTANDEALPFYALSELRFFENAPTAVAYTIALKMQFSELTDLKSEHSIRQAVKAINRQQYVTIAGKNQKGTLLESDDFAPKLIKLKAEIQSTVSTNI